VCRISINFTQRIDLGEYYEDVTGITKLRNEIYIMVCRSGVNSAMELSVFEDRIPFRLQKQMEMNQTGLLEEMESCEKESCLFVCGWTGQCVWKISIETEKLHKPIKWMTLDYVPYCMTVTSDGELLIVNQPSSILRIYGSDATLLRSIQFPAYIKNPYNAVKTSIGNFLIFNQEEEEEKKEEDDADEKKEGETGSRQRKHKKKINYFVRELTSDGQTVIRNFFPSNETQQLNRPMYLSIDSDDQVFVADMNNDRVILLDSDLKWKCILCPTKDEEELKICSPSRMCYVEENKQLIVGGVENIGITNVYNLSRN